MLPKPDQITDNMVFDADHFVMMEFDSLDLNEFKKINELPPALSSLENLDENSNMTEKALQKLLSASSPPVSKKNNAATDGTARE